jgi:hypothetical protein
MRGLIILLILLPLLAMACTPTESAPVSPSAKLEAVDLADLKPVTGQIVYVPAYSEVHFLDNQRTLDLAVTLTIHNTNFETPIILTSVRYYDTAGAMVEEYFPSPVKLGPMATTAIVLAQKDDRGGVGANFIVEWVAESASSEPVIEALMVSTSGSQGVSLLSPGRVIGQLP